MDIALAIKILKQPEQRKTRCEEAREAIKSEAESCSTASLYNLANEIKQSMDPEFSYQLMSALLHSCVLSGAFSEKLNGNIMFKGMFINKQLGSETVKDGLWKCMVALTACTGATGLG